MQPLELTEQQKEILLEMAKTLFPEFKVIHYKPGIPLPILCFLKGTKISRIHWFEFCMLHLCKKIFNTVYPDDSDYIYEFQGDCLMGGIHPVDYLYEQFLKIKPSSVESKQ